MSRKTVYMDDMDEGVEADAGTVRFSLEGTAYEIDLCNKNATKLRSVLGPYVSAARVVSKAKPAAKAKYNGQSPLASGYNTEQLMAVRSWANRNGYTVSDRGRVPTNVIKAFEEAGGIGSVVKDITDPVFSTA